MRGAKLIQFGRNPQGGARKFTAAAENAASRPGIAIFAAKAVSRMITFFVCLALLVGAYFTYSKVLARAAGAGEISEMPSRSRFDGVDYIPMPAWKTFLIQLLNIAGLGPIFGAVLGATYGPVAFVWITLGGIFGGAMHDYMAGMISLRSGGASLPEIVGRYLGLSVKQTMRLFTVLLMVLVGAVFMVGPAELIAARTGWDASLWVWIILAYYLLATLLPIDRIIGRVYPLFGAALVFMAVAIMAVMLAGDYPLPELTTLRNMKSDPEAFPVIPTLFITIACGAISGFHATQSPMMARCLTDPGQGRPVFYGAMIAECVIALIWAAAAMAFFGDARQLGSALAGHGDDAAWAVNLISSETLGRLGGILAFLGVIAAPITSGDTAFRSARLMVADFMGVEQRTLWKRLAICIPLFAAGYLITQADFGVIWRYFAWANQTLAVFTLWAVTVWLRGRGPRLEYISLPVALFMTFICTSYLLSSGQMLGLPYAPSLWGAGAFTLGMLLLYIFRLRKNGKTGA